jgi:hypothetical protein
VKVILNSDNAKALQEFAAIEGVSLAEFVNELISLEFVQKLDDAEFIIEYFLRRQYSSRKSAGRVAAYIDEKAVDVSLSGEPSGLGNVASQVIEPEPGVFEIDAHRLGRDGWEPYFNFPGVNNDEQDEED